MRAAPAPRHARRLDRSRPCATGTQPPRRRGSSFKKPIAINKNFADAHSNMALSLFTLGQSPRGSADTNGDGNPRKTRRAPCGYRGRPGVVCPWRLRTISPAAEQGLGDNAQFVRYARLLARWAQQWSSKCSPNCRRRLRAPTASHRAMRANPARLRCHRPLGSLAVAFRQPQPPPPIFPIRTPMPRMGGIAIDNRGASGQVRGVRPGRPRPASQSTATSIRLDLFNLVGAGTASLLSFQRDSGLPMYAVLLARQKRHSYPLQARRYHRTPGSADARRIYEPSQSTRLWFTSRARWDARPG